MEKRLRPRSRERWSDEEEGHEQFSELGRKTTEQRHDKQIDRKVVKVLSERPETQMEVS